MLDLDLYGRYMTEMYQTYQLYQQTMNRPNLLH